MKEVTEVIEIVKFRPEEIDEAIEGLDGLRDIIAPVLRRINGDGMGEQDAQQFIRQLTLAKHALIAMGGFLEGKMAPEPLSSPLTLEELREMDGEPVWVKVVDHTVFADNKDDFDGWGMCRSSWVRVWDERRADTVKVDYDFEDYGKTWLAYRRRPEGGSA